MKYRKIHYEVINGKNCRVDDIGVDDPVRARQNREMVKEGKYTAWWKAYEEDRDALPEGEFESKYETTGEGQIVSVGKGRR